MIRGYRYRYVLIRDILGREKLPLLLAETFKRLFGEILFYESRPKMFYANVKGRYILRTTHERLDERLSTFAYARGIVVELISGTLKTLKEHGIYPEDQIPLR